MVLLVTTPRILSALDSVSLSDRQQLDLPPSASLDSPISHNQLIRLSRHLRSNQDDASSTSWSLNSLLRGTKVYVPPPPKKPDPSPEYLALKARLLAAAEKDAYNRLMNPSTTTTTTNPNPIFTSSTPTLSSLTDPHPSSTSSKHQASDSEDTITPSLVLNIFLSIILTGFSVYFALTRFQTSEIQLPFISTNRANARMSEPVRVLASLAVAGGVGVAEVVIYAIYLGKVERAREREGRLRERKVVVGTEEVRGRKMKDGGDGDGEDDATGETETEEIWGRGVNGGLRRRVREKWEEGEREKGRERDEANGLSTSHATTTI